VKDKIKIIYGLFYFGFSMFAGSFFISDLFNMNSKENYKNFWNMINIDIWLPFVMLIIFVKIVESYKKNHE
jgi:hypothetical protein